MARRRSHKSKRHHTRRRRTHRMAGIGGSLASAAYVVGGAVIAQALGKAVGTALASSSMSATTKNLIVSAAPIVGGLVTPKVIKGDTGAKLASGMIAVGGLKLVQSAGILNGIGAYNYGNKPVKNIAGYQGASSGTYIAGIRKAAMMENC